mgnify:FL=1
MEDLEILRKRLLYQSQHRGMREMDFLLGGFAQNHLNLMSLNEIKQFEILLAFPDQDLYGWFFEEIPFPQNAPSFIIKMIQEYATQLS